MSDNSVELVEVGNIVALKGIQNSIDISLFDVTSEYIFLTQFQPYEHNERMTYE